MPAGRHRLERGRHDVRVRPRAGQAAAGRGGLTRRRSDAHVQLPDERVASVHAEPGADLHEPGLAAGGRGDHRHPDGATSGARRTSTASRAAPTTASTCSAGPVTTTTPTTSWACSSARPSNEWGFDNPELFAALTEARGTRGHRGADGAVQGDQRADRRVQPGHPARAPGAVAGVRRARHVVPGQPGQRRGVQPDRAQRVTIERMPRSARRPSRGIRTSGRRGPAHALSPSIPGVLLRATRHRQADPLLIPTLIGLSILLFIWVRSLPGGPRSPSSARRRHPRRSSGSTSSTASTARSSSSTSRGCSRCCRGTSARRS